MALKDEIRSELAGCTLFRDVDPDCLDAIAKRARRAQIPAGGQIFDQGADATMAYVLTAGTVELTLPMTIRGTTTAVSVDEKEPGSFVGWSTLVAPYRYHLGARAKTDVEVLTIDRGTLEEVLAGSEHAHLKILINTSETIAERLTLLEAMLQHDLQQWVADK